MQVRKLFTVICILFFHRLCGQNVQWATKVLEFSSQYGETDYAAQGITGFPSSMPGGGNTVLAWSPKNNSRQEFIKVGFKTPKPVSRVVVAENVGAGSIRKIILLDNRFSEHLIYSAEPKLLPAESRLFQISFPMTTYPVAGVYVEIDASLRQTAPQLDAIGISDSDTPIEISINLAADMKFSSKPTNLGANINSSSNDVYPVISPDGQKLYFTRFNHPGNTGGEKAGMDIWVASLKPDGTWSPARNAGFPLNGADPAENNYVVSALPDGNTLIVGGDRSVKGLSASNNTGSNWSVPKPIEIDNYYKNGSENSFCMANDGKTLLIGIERDDTYGRQDLYVSFRKANGNWSEPVNLGPDVNTVGNDYTPFLAADGVTLYFSSNGYPGYGDNDIYITRRLDDSWKHWSKPQNLGNIINTPGWDAYYTVPASGDYAYFVSSNNSFGGTDLYKVLLPNALRPNPVVLISGRVLNAKTRQPIAAEVDYETFPDGKQVGTAHANTLTGNYKITLPAGAVYGFLAYAKGYFSVNESIDLSQQTNYKELTRDLYLIPIEAGQPIMLNNIFFAQSDSTLLSSSFPELNRLALMMRENPTIEILLEGHTDYVGLPADNLKLSQNRVKAVKDYLVRKGISSRRIQTRAFGGTQPIVISSNEAERKRNRRVELRVLKK